MQSEVHKQPNAQSDDQPKQHDSGEPKRLSDANPGRQNTRHGGRWRTIRSLALACRPSIPIAILKPHRAIMPEASPRGA